MEAHTLELLELQPERDTAGPYGQYVKNSAAETLSLVIQTLSLVHFEHDAKADEGVRLLEEGSKLQMQTSGLRGHALYVIHKNLSAAYSRLLFLSYQQQLFHDGFRSVSIFSHQLGYCIPSRHSRILLSEKMLQLMQKMYFPSAMSNQ